MSTLFYSVSLLSMLFNAFDSKRRTNIGLQISPNFAFFHTIYFPPLDPIAITNAQSCLGFLHMTGKHFFPYIYPCETFLFPKMASETIPEILGWVYIFFPILLLFLLLSYLLSQTPFKSKCIILPHVREPAVKKHLFFYFVNLPLWL